jgi:hypothetical protein
MSTVPLIDLNDGNRIPQLGIRGCCDHAASRRKGTQKSAFSGAFASVRR